MYEVDIVFAGLFRQTGYAHADVMATACAMFSISCISSITSFVCAPLPSWVCPVDDALDIPSGIPRWEVGDASWDNSRAAILVLLSAPAWAEGFGPDHLIRIDWERADFNRRRDHRYQAQFRSGTSSTLLFTAPCSQTDDGSSAFKSRTAPTSDDYYCVRRYRPRPE